MLRIIISLILTVIAFTPGISRAAEKTIGDTTIETGYCDRDIMPFLETAVQKWGKYFLKIHADCNEGYISIKINSSGKSQTFNELKKATFSFTKELTMIFPLSIAVVKVFPAAGEKSWHIMHWQAGNGEIISYQEN